jgi:hypothetical protein
MDGAAPEGFGLVVGDLAKGIVILPVVGELYFKLQ